MSGTIKVPRFALPGRPAQIPDMGTSLGLNKSIARVARIDASTSPILGNFTQTPLNDPKAKLIQSKPRIFLNSPIFADVLLYAERSFSSAQMITKSKITCSLIFESALLIYFFHRPPE